LGFPVSFDPKRRGYGLRTPLRIKPPAISEDEWAALLLGAHIFSLSDTGEFGQLVRQAIDKLLAQTSAAVRDEVSTLLNSVVDDFPPRRLRRDATGRASRKRFGHPPEKPDSHRLAAHLPAAVRVEH